MLIILLKKNIPIASSNLELVINTLHFVKGVDEELQCALQAIVFIYATQGEKKMNYMHVYHYMQQSSDERYISG
jgi:hypothetical protein